MKGGAKGSRNFAHVSAAGPSLMAIVASAGALIFSATTISSPSHDPLVGSLSISLPGPGPAVVEVRATTIFHTIDSDFFAEPDGTEYIQTGDIPAMWLRDSSAQTIPYVRFANTVLDFQPIVRAVIQRDARNVLTDPYANAFTQSYHVWEEKWEPDSLASPVLLAYAYWRETADRQIFTPQLHWALERIVGTYACEQRHDQCSTYTSRFLSDDGRGAQFRDTDLIWGAFRPSDDPSRYPFNIPQNMMASVALEMVAVLALDGYRDDSLAIHAAQLAVQIRAAIYRYGRVYDFRFGWLYAYEVDGRGDFALMDDANWPNLISAPLFEYLPPDDPTYQNTRRFSLSPADPYYYSGKFATGLGSSHTPTGWVWPLGLISEAFTASTGLEVATLLKTISATSGSDELMHESFDPDDPTRFTRPEFGWANASYAELLFRSVAGFPAPDYRADPLPRILPLGMQTPVVTSLPDQLAVRGAVISALQFSCTNALPYCYIR